MKNSLGITQTIPVNNTSKGLIENSYRESNYEKADKENLQGTQQEWQWIPLLSVSFKDCTNQHSFAFLSYS